MAPSSEYPKAFAVKLTSETYTEKSNTIFLFIGKKRLHNSTLLYAINQFQNLSEYQNHLLQTQMAGQGSDETWEFAFL